MLREFILYRLIFAHVVADFPLQFNIVYKFKVEKREGLWVHILIHSVVMILFLAPILELRQWSSIVFFITLCHYFSDRLKLIVHEEFEITNTNGFLSTFFFLLDQILHFVIIFASLSLIEDVPFNPEAKTVISYLYYSNSVIIILVFIILAIYFSPIFATISSKIFFNPHYNSGNELVFEKKGILYRFFITLFMLFYYTWILSLVLIAIRTFFIRKESQTVTLGFYKHSVNTLIPLVLGFICFLTGWSMEAYRYLLGFGI